ncbi:leucyl/phenylalanyl-tRNA--protein transferase [Winogradskyella maritima]|uniref:Leucyl/phenylalanyl-tRNA--protein transferase n=1 Tax=Winogradskyella maritima TaxID=1517766 RepID=A0ABV8AFS1_9FLAO|nr:leucyl/phenylalanyl-tRNA--protein transferase [Winogradskyella maritima]
MHFLDQRIEFPDVSKATHDGLLAVGGDLSPERLLHAYSRGIFPWFEEGEAILWWSPDPRFVLFPNELKVSKSMKQLLKTSKFQITINEQFEQVISHCANIKRDGQAGTWITSEMKTSYLKLHELGYATSVEVWEGDELVGGLYGIDLKNGMFCGESMFALKSNASKYGFISFIQQSNFKLIDCQIHTPHLESLGAKLIPRQEFISFL